MPATECKSQFSLIITGDTSFGENYQAREESCGRENILKNRGYAHTMIHLAPLLQQSDLVLCNLETVITTLRTSPFAQTKGYVHWSDVQETPKQLTAHNIKAVSLANNHSIDFGTAGLSEMLHVLADNGITAFGAGHNSAEAASPFDYNVTLTLPNGTTRLIRIRVYAAFEVDDSYRTRFKAYAGASEAGTNPLVPAELCREISRSKAEEPDRFVIAVLHWRRDYKWRSDRQAAVAQELVRAGVDLMIGHGSHMMQELEKVDGRWIVHGLGNFVFNSPGRYAVMNVPPFSLVARLTFDVTSLSPSLRLYPIFTDNRITRYQTRFVTDSEFSDAVGILREKSTDAEAFDRDISCGRDEYGHFLIIPIGPLADGRTSEENVRAPSPAADQKSSSATLDITHVFKGANIYCSRQAIRFTVEYGSGLLQYQKRNRLIDSLFAVFPDLSATLRTAGPPASESTPGNTTLNDLTDITAAVVFTLMQRVDENIPPLITLESGSSVCFSLICEYHRSAENAQASARLAVKTVQSMLDDSTDLAHVRREVADFVKIGKRRERLPGNTVHILEEAEARGIPINNSGAGPTILGQGRFQKRLSQTMTSNTGFIAVRLAKDKLQTHSILRQAGIPVPDHRAVEQAEDAVAAAETIGYPVVVKPAGGSMGRGVSVRLVSPQDVAAAFHEAVKIGKPVIVEKCIAGSDHRLLVVDGTLVAACQRVPGHVVGNGTDSVSTLLSVLNSDPRRDNRFMHTIEIDFDAERMLVEQGLALNSVPQTDEIVYLRSKANSSAGGTCTGLTELVHPDNRRVTVAAARAVGLDIAGVDFITTDISRSYKETGGAICEVNNCPGITDLHVSPSSGSCVQVAPYILDMLFPQPASARVKTIAICGERNPARLSRAVEHQLQMAGYCSGRATRNGLWIGGDCVETNDCSTVLGAGRVLWNPAVDAAVLEVSITSILREGLGFDRAEVVVITDVPQNSETEVTSEALAAIATTIRTAHRAVIFDSDDPLPEVLQKAAHGKMIYRVSAASANIPSTDRFTVLTAADNTTVLVESAGERQLIHLPEFCPATRDTMLAIAACHAVGISLNDIEDAFKALCDCSVADQLLLSGLNTVIGRVLLATPRNSSDVKIICDTARTWAAPQRPDLYIQMSYCGDPALSAALASESSLGFGTKFELNQDGNLAHQFTQQHLSTRDPAGKLLIITDDMEYFRRTLPLQSGER
ncbi:MAG: CapA family protein [Desulfuromonadales bacterium]